MKFILVLKLCAIAAFFFSCACPFSVGCKYLCYFVLSYWLYYIPEWLKTGICRLLLRTVVQKAAIVQVLVK